MNENGSNMPPALTKEKPAANLAALVMNSSLDRLTVDLISQWQKRDRFAEVRKHGIRPLDRALFYGPPGNGKTMSAQLVAAKLVSGNATKNATASVNRAGINRWRKLPACD